MKKYRYIQRAIEIVAALLIIAIIVVLFETHEEEATERDQNVYELNEGWTVQKVHISQSSTRSRTSESAEVNPGMDSGNGERGEDPQQKNAVDGQRESESGSPAEEGKTSQRQGRRNTLEEDLISKALEGAEKTDINLPYSEVSEPGDTFVYTNTIPEDYEGLTLTFYSTESVVRVIMNDRIIYTYGMEDNRRFGKSPGSNENFVDLPSQFRDGEIRIELTSYRYNGAASMSRVKVAARDIVILELIQSNLINIICCIVIVILSMILFLLVILRIYTKMPVRGEAYLALFGLDVGIYYFIQTKTLSIFFGYGSNYTMLSYIGMLLLSFFLAKFFAKNYRDEFPKRFNVLLLILNINVVGQLLLQIVDVVDLADMELISRTLLLAVLLVSGISVCQSNKREKIPRMTLKLLPMVLLIVTGGIHMYSVQFLEGDPFETVARYGGLIFCAIVTIDQVMQLIAEYKERGEESERQLREKVEMVEQKNEQLIQAKTEAEEAKREAQDANEAKGRFLANMSHEIRTPINAVLGMDEMILRESAEPDTREYAMDIFTAGQTLLSLINDILDFSKIESGKLEIVPVDYDVSSMIHDLVNMISQRAQGKNLKLEVEVDSSIPARLFGDDVRIRQILTNILTNAVKYTHEGTVWFRVSGMRSRDTEVLHFEVEDTGIGIKEEDLPKLFAEFERIEESRNRNIEGTGLGMNITVSMLAMMGSRLQVESVYGEGSKFFFDLNQRIMDETPIGDFNSRVRNMAADFEYSVAFCAPDAHILVVDDNTVNRRVFMSLLKQTKILVDQAASGKECLELVQKTHYDLIFLDHMMPEMDGVETFHRMKELTDYPCKDTPVIVLTANAVAGAREKYLQEGFDSFLSKPIVSEKLEELIRKLLPPEMIQERPAEEIIAAAVEKRTGNGEVQLPEDLPDVDGLDWNYAWMHLPDRQLLEYTVKEFYGQILPAAEKLEAQQEECLSKTGSMIPDTESSAEDESEGEGEKPIAAYRIQVHAMKSLAATIGIVPLAGMAKVLEFAARDGDLETLRAVSPVFLAEWRTYHKKLCGVFGITAEEPKQHMEDISIIQALLDMLRTAMEEMDIDRADEVIRQLRLYDYPGEIGYEMVRLSDAVTNLDVEECSRIVEKLQGMLVHRSER